MADSASPILLQRIQSVGSNVNLWGGYINTDLETLERAAKGYQALAVTGDATIAWTNYSNSNTGSVAFLKLTGSVTGVLTFPSYQNFISVWNANSASVTIKCSGGTGVALASGQRAMLYCDGTDYYNAGPTVAPTTTQSSASNAYALWGAVQSAIATASLPATAGTVLVSGADTTANYISAKLVAGTDITLTASGAGNETLTIANVPYWNTPRALAFADSPVTALDRDVLLLNTSGGAITVNLPASGRVWVVDTSGNANVNNITLTPAGVSTITFGTIDTAYFGGVYRLNSANWDLN